MSLYTLHGKPETSINLLEDEQGILKPRTMIYACRNDNVVLSEMQKQNNTRKCYQTEDTKRNHDFQIKRFGVCGYCGGKKRIKG